LKHREHREHREIIALNKESLLSVFS